MSIAVDSKARRRSRTRRCMTVLLSLSVIRPWADRPRNAGHWPDLGRAGPRRTEDRRGGATKANHTEDSVRVGGDDLALRAGAERIVGSRVDRLLEEPDRPVPEGEVGAAGVVALEGVVDGLVTPAVQALGEIVQIREAASGLVGRVHLAVVEVGLPVQRDDG